MIYAAIPNTSLQPRLQMRALGTSVAQKEATPKKKKIAVFSTCRKVLEKTGKARKDVF